MTYLEAINNVLVRLRESTVLSSTTTAYSKLVGSFVNDAKAQVENAYPWNSLNNDIIIATTSNVANYTLVGSGQRFRVLDALNDTTNVPLTVKPWAEINRNQRIGASGNTQPLNYCFNGVDSVGDTIVTLYPTPDAVYSICFTSSVPQLDLVNDSDVLKAPNQPTVLGAYARAVAERGEDQGMLSSEVYGLYKDALSDAIAIESSRTADDASWAPF